MEGISDAAWIQKPDFSAPIYQRPVGMAKEKKIQILFFCGIGRRKEGLFDAVCVAVAEEDSFVFHTKELFSWLGRTVVAISGNLADRNVREKIEKLLSIPPAVAQMKNHPRRFRFYSPQHIGDVSVRVR
jgi:hypothetical protein